jgi:pimeloyl-ACP methyl ester carboxylesterase
MLGGETYTAALLKARSKIDKGEGDELVPAILAPFPLSYRSFYDTINPDGDYNIFPYNETMNNLRLSKKELFREFKRIEKPVHVIYGQFDEYCYGDVPRCVDILKKQVADKDNFTFTIIPDGTQGLDGKEEELGELVSSWVRTTS